MHRWFIVLVLGSAAIALAACSGSSTPAVQTVTQTSVMTVTSAASAAPAPAAEPAPAATWTMPDLVGRNLQDAQDEIQRLTGDAIFYTSSTDLTGKSRNQIMDRNWQVCSSTPSAGTPITTDTKIDFGVVRIDSESCP